MMRDEIFSRLTKIEKINLSLEVIVSRTPETYFNSMRLLSGENDLFMYKNDHSAQPLFRQGFPSIRGKNDGWLE